MFLTAGHYHPTGVLTCKHMLTEVAISLIHSLLFLMSHVNYYCDKESLMEVNFYLYCVKTLGDEGH